jgi:hypothetical protein
VARDNVVPFNQQDSGRMGFRYEWEPADERPLVIYPEPFWRDRMEQATYEAAVSGNPRRQDEGPMAYVARIAEVVTGEWGQPVQAMPRARMSRRMTDERLAKLRAQLPSGTEIIGG